LSVPSVTRKTELGLPRYDDAAESDVFVLSDVEDLVPVRAAEGSARPGTTAPAGYQIDRFRPRWRGCSPGWSGGRGGRTGMCTGGRCRGTT
jgi:hypothetical protein